MAGRRPQRRKLTPEDREALAILAKRQYSLAEARRLLGWWSPEADEAFRTALVEAEGEAREAIYHLATQGQSLAAQQAYLDLARRRRRAPQSETRAEMQARAEMARMRSMGYSWEDYAGYIALLLSETSPADPEFHRLLLHYETALDRSQPTQAQATQIQVVVVRPDEDIPDPPPRETPQDG